MSIRNLLSTFLVFLPGLAVSSEGLKYAAGYMCDPQRMTEALVQACTRKNVDLSSRYAAALNGWFDRNHSEIERLKTECVAGIRKLSSSDAEFQDRMAVINRINDEAVAASGSNEVDLSFCGDLIEGLETGKSDLKNLPPLK